MKALKVVIYLLFFLPLQLLHRLYYWFFYRKQRLFYEPVRSVIVFKLDGMGDVLLATPLFKALKRRFKGCRLTVVVASANNELLDRSPYVDEVILFDASWLRRGLSGRRHLRDCLRAAVFFRADYYHLAVNPRDTSYLDSLLLSFVRARFKIGHDLMGAGFAITHRIKPPPPGLHQVARSLGPLEALGVRCVGGRPEIYTSMENDRITEMFLEDCRLRRGEKLVGIHPGAGCAAKEWPLSGFCRLAAGLARLPGVRLVLFGGVDDKDKVESIAAAVKGKRKPIDLAGKIGLRQMASVMARCRLVIANDSGPAHLAAATGKPLLSIFSGANEPEIWAPPGEQVEVISHKVPCAPCQADLCPLGHHDCMRKITVARVFTSAKRIITRAKSKVQSPESRVKRRKPGSKRATSDKRRATKNKRRGRQSR